jgi:hypothetical protein
LSYHEYYYRYGYTQLDYNHKLQKQYSGHKRYRYQPPTRPFSYRYPRGVRSSGSGLSFGVNYR